MTRSTQGKILACILIMILTIILFGCNADKRARKHQNWLKRHGYTVTDTITLPGKFTKGDTKFIPDTAALDSITAHFMSKLDSCNGKPMDSVTREKIIDRWHKSVKQIPCKISPVHDENERHILKIWTQNGELHYTIDDKPVQCIDEKIAVPEGWPWWNRWYWGFIACLLLVFLVNKFIPYSK